MKKLAGWLSLIMIVVLVSACSGGNEGNNGSAAGSMPNDSAGGETQAATPDAPGETVTIRISIPEGELSKELVAEFEAAHPNIKIEQVELDATKLAAQLATGSAPDVIRISGAFDTSSYVTRGIAMDISDRLDSSIVINKDDLLPIVDVYRFDGTAIGQGPIYGLPKDWSNDYAIFYNKKAFDAAGVPVPDATKPLTWPEVMELAKKLTIKDGNKVVQYGLSATEWGKSEPNFNFMLQYLVSADQPYSSDDNSSVDFNSQPVKDYIAMWVDAVKSKVGPNSLNNDQTPGGDLFLANKSAMIINGYWYSGVIRGNADTQTHLSDFGMLPTPTALGGKRVAPSGGATGAIINKNTEHPDEAWTFFEWYFGGKPADERAKTGWGLPIFQSKMALLPQETDFDKQVYTVLQDELKYTGEFLPVNPYLSGGGWGIFDKYAQQLYFDKTTIDKAVEGMAKDANVAITEAMSALGK